MFAVEYQTTTCNNLRRYENNSLGDVVSNKFNESFLRSSKFNLYISFDTIECFTTSAF